MLGVQILAWSFAIFLALGRVAEFGNKQVNNGHACSKMIDNVTIILMLILLMFLYK